MSFIIFKYFSCSSNFVSEKFNQKLDGTVVGFSIDPFSGRDWVSVQYSEKLDKMVERKIKVFSLDEAISSNESLRDSHNPRGSRIGYLVKF